jgi:hypothetical protein
MGIEYRSHYHGGRFNVGAGYSKRPLEDAKIQEIKDQIN